MFVSAAVACAPAQTASAGSARVGDETTLDALVERTEFLQVKLSPDGARVAFLTARGLPREDVYEFRFGVVAVSKPLEISAVAIYQARDYEEQSQFEWSPDSEKVLYTAPGMQGTELRLWEGARGGSRPLLSGHGKIQLAQSASDGSTAEITAEDHAQESARSRPLPKDMARRMRADFNFSGPAINPPLQLPKRHRSWEFRWSGAQLLEKDPAHTLPRAAPEAGDAFDKLFENFRKIHGGYRLPGVSVVSPDGQKVARIVQWMRWTNPKTGHSPKELLEFSRVLIAEAGAQDRSIDWTPTASERDGRSTYLLGWSPDSKELYFIDILPTMTAVRAWDRNGAQRIVYQENALLRSFGSTQNVESYSFSGAARRVALVRSTNFQPEELVTIDLTSGKLTRLYVPNEAFTGKFHASVRYISLEDQFLSSPGRLYLPAGHTQPLPLVVTLYLSSPGFEISTGDEIPIHALVEHGLAVFTFYASLANIVTPDGDFAVQLSRVERPRKAIEGVVRQLSREGVIDPARVGLAGLSYGSEVAMYCYWKSALFRTISSATASWEPANFFFIGLPAAVFFEQLGFKELNAGAAAQWKLLSAGLNARADLPPLLWQSPDEERGGQLETWYRLQRAGAQVEWYEYPNEGHWKRHPANKWWVYRRNLDWFRFWLQDYEDPVPEKQEQYVRWRDMRKNWEAAKNVLNRAK